jgi:hypothetical protein
MEKQLTDKEKAFNIIQNLDNSVKFPEIHREIAKMDKSVWKNPISQYVFIGIGIIAGLNFIYFFVSVCTDNFYFYKHSPIYNTIKLVDILLYSCWAIGVPFYFFFEYIKLFPHKLDKDQLADLNYTQTLASKVWAALLLIFGLFLYMKYGVRP